MINFLLKESIMNYYIIFEQIINFKLNDVEMLIRKADKKKISDIKLIDFIYFNGKPISTGNGIYAFWKGDNTCLYIGRAKARSFIERIPSHFDLRESAWFNTYLMKLVKYKYANYLGNAAIYSLDTALSLINFEEKDNLEAYCNKFEKLMRFIFKPELNLLSPKLNRSISNNIDNNMILMDSLWRI